MAGWKQLSRVNQALFPQFESLKHGRLAKLFHLVRDYKAVAISGVKYARKRPIKFGSQLIILGSCTYLWTKTPDMQSYENDLFDNSNQLLQVSSLIRNRRSESYIRELIECYYQGRLTCKNFGIFSLVMKSDFGNECDTFDKNCYYRQPRWTTLQERIVDIGFHGRWLFLESYMTDFDVNDEQFSTQS
eukprot:gene8734-14756_t